LLLLQSVGLFALLLAALGLYLRRHPGAEEGIRGAGVRIATGLSSSFRQVLDYIRPRLEALGKEITVVAQRAREHVAGPIAARLAALGVWAGAKARDPAATCAELRMGIVGLLRRFEGFSVSAESGVQRSGGGAAPSDASRGSTKVPERSPPRSPDRSTTPSRGEHGVLEVRDVPSDYSPGPSSDPCSPFGARDLVWCPEGEASPDKWSAARFSLTQHPLGPYEV
jgi:hypothetical protein